MTVQLKPDIVRYYEEQVRAGRFQTLDDAVHAALQKVRDEEELLASELTDEDVAAIEEGLAQEERGEMRPWEEVKEELRAKYLR